MKGNTGVEAADEEGDGSPARNVRDNDASDAEGDPDDGLPDSVPQYLNTTDSTSRPAAFSSPCPLRHSIPYASLHISPSPAVFLSLFSSTHSSLSPTLHPNALFSLPSTLSLPLHLITIPTPPLSGHSHPPTLLYLLPTLPCLCLGS